MYIHCLVYLENSVWLSIVTFTLVIFMVMSLDKFSWFMKQWVCLFVALIHQKYNLDHRILSLIDRFTA